MSSINVGATVVPENTKLAPSASTPTGVYRQARDGGYNYRTYERPQSRCISCLYAAMTGGSGGGGGGGGGPDTGSGGPGIGGGPYGGQDRCVLFHFLP